MRRPFMIMILVVLALLLAGLPVSSPRIIAQSQPPILVFISWDGAAGWVIEKLLNEGKLPNLARLVKDGVYVRRTVGNWPSLTAAGHAAVFTGTYGNLNGITGNSIPAAPFDQYQIGTSGSSGFSADNLLAEPFWVTAARQGRKAATISVTQVTPFDMVLDAGYTSPQGAKSFGAYGDKLWLADPYGAVASGGDPAVLRASASGITISDSDGSGWSNLPRGSKVREFTLGDGDKALPGLLVATDGITFDEMILSAKKDYAAATARLKAAPFTNDTSNFSRPIHLTLRGVSGWTQLRLTEIQADGSDFTLAHTSLSDFTDRLSNPDDAIELLSNAGAFGGNGLPLPRMQDLPDLPNLYGEMAFQVNDWFFKGLTWAIKQNKADVYFTYSPFPDEWFHAYYGYLDKALPAYSEAAEQQAWQYTDAMFGNLDAHLGDVMAALDDTGRIWDIVMFSDHGFNSYSRIFYPNRVLTQAGLLSMNIANKVDPAKTKALFALENTGGIYINAVAKSRVSNGHLNGIVTDAEYDAVVQEVTDALLAMKDPDTRRPIVKAIYKASELSIEGIGGTHGADLYIELNDGYFWNSSAGLGPIVSGAFLGQTGVHGGRPAGNDALQGYAVLSGANFVDSLIVDITRSIDLSPTAARAIGLDPPANATGAVHLDWVQP